MRGLNELSALEASKLIRKGEMTSEALLGACLKRINEREETVRAWTYLDREKALEEARSLDRSSNRGLLHGIPIGVKDIMDTADMPTSYGSPIYSGHRPAWDASCVALIRAAGGLVLGKTVTTEFAVFHPGKTTNPHNPAHTPGGSSSGSAAAVADFMVPLALGTQTGGSTIRPASFCGVIGYKPSFGLINRAGVKPCAESLDTIGIFARNAQDAALLASVLTGRPFNTNELQPAAPRVGLCRTYEWPTAAPETVTAFERAGKQLKDSGARVQEVELPEPFSRLADAQSKVMDFEMARSFAYEYSAHRDQLSEKLKEIIASGQTISTATYDNAVALASECSNLLERSFAGLDVLLAPSAIGEAPEGLTSTGDPIFNRIWTFLHVPCINIPAFTGPRGLPVGLQIIGPLWSDSHLLATSDWIFKHLNTKSG
jgi:Asp-tRNA(Asn)/Glu-tRNA(Gln) amidotransferase A subunit family amidase